MTGAWFSAPAFERLAGSLLHFVWQGALIALLAALTLHLLKRRSAQFRYVAACVSLLLMLLAPILTFVFYAETGTLAQRWLQSFHGAALVGASNATSDGVALWTGRIVLLWAAGVALCLMRLLGGWLLSRRLVRSATAVMTPPVLAVMQRARTALAFHQSVRLLAGARIDTPMVVGWLRPAILLPASALTGLSATHLLAILAHELAHVRRHDFLINAIQRVVECVLFYHPAVWWISGRIRVERERCCDDLAVVVCGDRLVYAQALMALEDARSREPALALAAAGGGLTDRVRRILGAGSRGVDWQSSVAVGLCVALLGAAGLWHPVSAEPAAASPTKAEPTRARQVEAEPRAAKGSAFDALAAILTAQSAPAAQTAPQTRPRLKDPATPVTQPTIAPARAAAREKLGQLRVDYSADSFVKQATEGDTIAVNLFLAAAMNINALDKEGYTALIGAARARQTETVQALIAAGADVNIAATPNSAAPGSALSFAARNGDLATMQVLLSGGAQVNSEVGAGGGFTALTSAVEGGHLNAVELLVNRGADLEATAGNDGGTPLFLAACQRRNDILRLLLERGADIRATASNRSRLGTTTALHCAVGSRNVDGLRLLLDKGADINAIASETGRTPLLEALERAAMRFPFAASGNRTLEEQATEAAAVVRLLIDRGADVNLADRNGRTPLMAAVLVKDVGSVRALLAKGANPNVADSRGQTPLKAAAGSDEIVRALTEAGAKN